MTTLSVRSYATYLTGCFVLMWASGCGGPKLFPVTGHVVYQGGSEATALEKGMVIFQPAEEGMPNISPRAYIKEDASFEMESPSDGKGVRPGKYKIIVNPPPFFAKSREESFNPPHLIDDSYRDFKTSGLDITVTGPVSDYKITVSKTK